MNSSKLPRSKRIAYRFAPFSIMLGVLMFIFGIRNQLFSGELITEKNFPYTLMGSFYIVVGLGAWAYRFIETGNAKDSTLSQHIEIIKEYSKREIDEIRKHAADAILKSENNSVNPEEFDKIIKDKIIYSLNYTLKDYIEEKYGNNALRTTELQRLETQIRELQTGVNVQIGKLSRSGTINLIIGLFTTLIAIGILTSLILSVQAIHFTTINDFLVYLIPRISLAIFIEIFSFFFLKLYKRTLEDVKYFHNERTNIDSKVIALNASIYLDKEDILKEIIKSFSTVERNFVLKKGESTIGLETVKMENQQEINFMTKVNELVDRIKK